MQEPLPAELFYHDDQMIIRFKKSINIDLGIAPIRMAWLPFFDQMSQQLTQLIKKSVNKNFLRKYDYILWHEFGVYKGLPYKKHALNGMDWTLDYYTGRFIKKHIDGYAYGKLSILPIIGTDQADMWIRWKSNLPGYEYIEPDDELNLTEQDITFEICTEIPENLAQRFYARSAKIDCSKWIALLNDESHYPKKARCKSAAGNFCFEIAPDCNYPDTCFTIYLRNKCNDEIEKKIENAFLEFTEYYNIEHKNNIHDIINVKNIADYPDRIDDEKIVQFHVDFGNCNPKVIESLVSWLRSYDFGIEKINVR